MQSNMQDMQLLVDTACSSVWQEILKPTNMQHVTLHVIYNFKVVQNGDLHCRVGNYKQNWTCYMKVRR